MQNLIQFGKIVSINNQFGVLRASVAILSDEVPEDVILVSSYGQNGNPPIAGATCLIFSPFGQETKFGIAFNANITPVIKTGEAIIYNNKGSTVYLKGGSIEIKSGSTIINLKKDNNVEITAPQVTINGNLSVSGTLGVAGDSTLSGIGTNIAGKVFLTHTHSGVTIGPDISGPVV